MAGRDLFLLQHAHLHAAEVSGDPTIHSLEDGLLAGLSDADLRARPDGLNSIAWLLWHITRFEDVAINAVLAAAPEVLDREGRSERLGVGTRLVGTGAGDDELEEFAARVDPAALLAYRHAVGRATRAWAAGADFEALDTVPDVARMRERTRLAFGAGGAWVGEFWAGRTVGGMLALPVLGHSFVHIGEARVARTRLGGVVR